MSAFSTGGIFGSLGLDLSGFTSGMLQAEGLSELFPQVITDFIANPILGIVDVAKEGGEAIFEIGKELKDVFFEVGNAAADASLAAEKAGVSIDYFTKLSAVGKTVRVTADDISAGLRFLNRNVEGVIDGSLPKAAAGFQKLGISLQFLKDHQGDTQAIAEATREGIGNLGTEAERTAVSMAILGRGGESLIPLFNMGPKFNELAGLMKSLGATETEESGKAGRSLLTLEGIVGAAWEGIEKAFAEPILNYLSDHLDEIIPQVKGLAAALRGDATALSNALGPEIKKIIDDLPAFEIGLERIADDLKTVIPAAVRISVASLSVLLGALSWGAKAADWLYDHSDTTGANRTGAQGGARDKDPATDRAFADAAAELHRLAGDVDRALAETYVSVHAIHPDAASPYATHPGGNVTVNASVDVSGIDPEKHAAAVVNALKAPLRDASLHQQNQFITAAKHHRVAAAIRGGG